MHSFATEFPVPSTHHATEVLTAIRAWLLRSPHTRLIASDLDGMDAGNEWSQKKGAESVMSLSVALPGWDAAAVRYSKTERGLEWVTTICFSREKSGSWIGIRVSCESQHPAARLPTAKKPVVVRTLLDRLGSAPDGTLFVQAAPVRLENVDIDVAAGCITGRAGCRLPVIYVSANAAGGHILDVDQLADSLAGMAHVVVEPNRSFSIRLKSEVASQNVYGGTIGIYWPDGGGRRSFFLDSALDPVNSLPGAVYDEVRAALANRRPLPRCTWAAVQEAYSRRIFNELKEQGSTEVDKYINGFDKEMTAKDEQLSDAEREIARLMAEVRKYEALRPMDADLSLSAGREQSLYSGELEEIVRDAMEDAVSRVTKDSRRFHVLTALLEANPANGGAKARREQLKALLRSSRDLNAKTRQGLLEMGFSISEEGKHLKLVYQGDDRYTFSLPKSGSDRRGGLNAAGDISRLLF